MADDAARLERIRASQVGVVQPDATVVFLLAEIKRLTAERDALRAALAWAVEWMEAYEGECMPEWREWQQRGRRALGGAAAGEGP